MTVRAVFGVLFGLLVSIAGVALVAWLLWRLWTRREEEAEPVAIEIEVDGDEPQVAAEAPAEEAAEPGATENAAEADKPQAAVAEAPAEEAAAEEPPREVADEEAPLPPDDLKIVEGIGPKIESVLQAAGIRTYAQLAATEPARIAEILEATDPRLRRLADPTTWPEQAALAAAGRLDDLEALKGTLKGGRRVR